MASPPESPFEVTMSLSRVSRKLNCEFKFTNTSEQEYYLSKRSTPLEGMKNRLLKVKYSRGDEEVPYRGILCKRAPLGKTEFVLFKSGETKTATIDLTKGYVFKKDGDYKFEFNRALLYLTKTEYNNIKSDSELSSIRSGDIVQASAKFKLVDVSTLDIPSHLKK